MNGSNKLHPFCIWIVPPKKNLERMATCEKQRWHITSSYRRKQQFWDPPSVFLLLEFMQNNFEIKICNFSSGSSSCCHFTYPELPLCFAVEVIACPPRECRPESCDGAVFSAVSVVVWLSHHPVPLQNPTVIKNEVIKQCIYSGVTLTCSPFRLHC